MRRIAIMIPTLAAAIMINAIPVLAEEGTPMSGQEQAATQRDECLLVALNCPDNVDTLQQRIDKLQAEINKGTAVYTNDELDKLNKKLKDAYDEYIDLTERP